jgi:hypothetical protein
VPFYFDARYDPPHTSAYVHSEGHIHVQVTASTSVFPHSSHHHLHSLALEHDSAAAAALAHNPGNRSSGAICIYGAKSPKSKTAVPCPRSVSAVRIEDSDSGVESRLDSDNDSRVPVMFRHPIPPCVPALARLSAPILAHIVCPEGLAHGGILRMVYPRAHDFGLARCATTTKIIFRKFSSGEGRCMWG